MPKQDPFTLEERVERLEKQVYKRPWTLPYIDWGDICSNIYWGSVLLIIVTTPLIVILAKC